MKMPDVNSETVAALCRQTHATGKRVADARHAAVAIEHGCRWVSRDEDFVEFARLGLDWEHLPPPDGELPEYVP